MGQEWISVRDGLKVWIWEEKVNPSTAVPTTNFFCEYLKLSVSRAIASPEAKEEHSLKSSKLVQ